MRLRTLSALLFAITLTVTPSSARAQDAIAAEVYADLKEIFEELIRDEVGKSTARFVATRPHVGVALAFYYRDALARLGSNYWGALPTALRRGSLDLITDAIYWRLEATTGDFSLDAFLRDRSVKIKIAAAAEERGGSPPQLLVDERCNFARTGAAKTNEDTMRRIRCAMTLAVRAQIDGKPEEVAFFVQELLTELFVLTASSANGLDLHPLFRGWVQRPQETIDHFRTLFSDSLLRDLASAKKVDCKDLKKHLETLFAGGAVDGSSRALSALCVAIGGGPEAIQGNATISLRFAAAGPKVIEVPTQALRGLPVGLLASGDKVLVDLVERAVDEALYEHCANNECSDTLQRDGKVTIELRTGEALLAKLEADYSARAFPPIVLKDRRRLVEVGSRLEAAANALATITAAIPAGKSQTPETLIHLVKTARTAQRLVTLYWRATELLSRASQDGAGSLAALQIIIQAFQELEDLPFANQSVVAPIRSAIKTLAKSGHLLELVRTGAREDYRGLVTALLDAAIVVPSDDRCTKVAAKSHRTLAKDPRTDKAIRNANEAINPAPLDEAPSSEGTTADLTQADVERQAEPSSPPEDGETTSSNEDEDAAAPPPTAPATEDEIEEMCAVQQRDSALKHFVIQFAAYVLEYTNASEPSAVSRTALKAAAKDLIGAQLELSAGLPDPNDTDAMRDDLVRGFYLPDVSLRAAWSPSYRFQAGSDGFRFVASADFFLKLRFAFTRYVGVQATAVDLLAPLTELAYREPGSYDNGELLALDLVRPRAMLMVGVPDFSRRLVVTGGLALRFISPRVVDGKAEADGEFVYKTGVWPEISAGATLLF